MGSLRRVNPLGNTRYTNENGYLHRDDGPAVEDKDGHKEWFINGVRHREDGPAVIFTDGVGWYFLNGNLCNKDEYDLELSKIKMKRILEL